jgi:hypothetical protein
VAESIIQFQEGRNAAIAGKKRDARKSADWLEGYDQVAYWQNAVKNWRNGESASR